MRWGRCCRGGGGIVGVPLSKTSLQDLRHRDYPRFRGLTSWAFRSSYRLNALESFMGLVKEFFIYYYFLQKWTVLFYWIGFKVKINRIYYYKNSSLDRTERAAKFLEYERSKLIFLSIFLSFSRELTQYSSVSTSGVQF